MDFERLIETERRNDDLLRQAREEAAGIRRAAHLRAEASRSEAESELATAAAATRDRIAARGDELLAAIIAGAREAAARFDAVPDQRLAEVAASLRADLLDPEASP